MRIFIAAVAVLWLPGRAIRELINCFGEHEGGIITSFGLSIAATPLAAMLSSAVGIELENKIITWTYIVCAIVILLGYLRRYLSFPVQSRKTSRHWQSAWGLVLIFFATLFLRFLQIRNLTLPSWVDSLHHTLIIQTIQEQGKIPDQIMAYTSIPFYYHFGFHTLAAVFGQLTDLTTPQSVLTLGQILNAMASLSVYHLTIKLTQRRYAGLGAAALTGFVSQMPAYYTSWGRYTLLTGMILLPIVMAAAIKTWRAPLKVSQGLQTALLTGGMILTHYLAAAYYICFLIAVALTTVTDNRHSQWQKRILSLGAWSSLGILFVTPWIIKVFPYVTPFISIQTMANTLFTDSSGWSDRLKYLWYLANHARSWVILALAFPEVITSPRYRSRTRPLIIWITILLALSNEVLCQIQPFRADLLLICLFLPMNILAATTLSKLRQYVGYMTNSQLTQPVISLSMIIALSVWGLSTTHSIITPANVLATKADVKALNWISENVPPHSKFLINVKHWQYNLYQGSDGGWWIPIFSQCKTILPPGIFYGWGNPRYIQEIKEVAQEAKKIDGCTPDFWKLVKNQDITHIYIGAKGETLQPVWFDRCPGVWRIYIGRNVHIYEIDKDR